MSAWIIDVYAEETNRSADHRCIAKGDTEQEALGEASKAYPIDKLVVSVGSTLPAAARGQNVRKLY
jgi:hypothetical protein